MKEEKYKITTFLKIFLIIILLIICIVTSFVTGQKYYDLKNTQLKNSNSQISTDIAKWKFRVTVVY